MSYRVRLRMTMEKGPLQCNGPKEEGGSMKKRVLVRWVKQQADSRRFL